MHKRSHVPFQHYKTCINDDTYSGAFAKRLLLTDNALRNLPDESTRLWQSLRSFSAFCSVLGRASPTENPSTADEINCSMKVWEDATTAMNTALAVQLLEDTPSEERAAEIKSFCDAKHDVKLPNALKRKIRSHYRPDPNGTVA